MALEGRKLNRLLRQRGAGLQRQIESDFSFKIGSQTGTQGAGSKQESAQPLPPRASSRRTPQPPLQRSSTRVTPAQRARSISSTRSRPSVSSRASRQRSLGPPSREPSQALSEKNKRFFETPAASKKRKRTTNDNDLQPPQNGSEDDLAVEEEHRSTARRMTSTPAPGSVSLLQKGQDNEPDELVSADPQFQVSSTAKSASRPKSRRQSPGSSIAEFQTPVTRMDLAGTPASNPSLAHDASVLAYKSKPLTSNAGVDQENQLEMSVSRRRASQRRVLSTSKELSSGAKPFLEPAYQALDVPEVVIEGPEILEDEEQENVDELPPRPVDSNTLHALTPRAQNTTLLTSPLFQPPAIESLVDDQAQDERLDDNTEYPTQDKSEDELAEESAPIPTRRPGPRAKGAPTKKSRNAREASAPHSTDAQADVPTTKRRKTNRGALIPVTVYRPSGAFPRLASSTQHDDTDSEVDDLARDPVAEADGTINPVDVLAQITSELIGSYITDFSERARSQRAGGSLSTQAKRQRQALQRFNFVLGDSLLTLSTALNTGAALEKHLRKTRRQRVALREELLDVRRQRDEVQAEMQSVRARYRRAMEETSRKTELVQGLEELADAVRRGRERARELRREDEGPEEDPLEMYDAVVAAVEGGGLVKRLETWNERLTAALETLESCTASAA